MLSVYFASLVFLFLSSSFLPARVESRVTSVSKVATAWFAGWHSDVGFPVSKVSWDKYTELTYAFAETTPGSISLNGSEPDVLPQFVSAAHAHGVKVKVSVGGWTGSLFWSSNVATAQNRTRFVKTLIDFVKKYDLDGLDFDWEYPNNQGIGCNTINKHDTANFLSFIQELRKDPLGSTLILSAATAISPFIGPDGNPLSDVSAFSKVLDYVEVMNYDIWGPWSPTVGPNSPLNDTCASSANQGGSAVSAVKAWNEAGMPLNQIVLGVAAYGHSFTVLKASAFKNGSKTSLAPYPPFDASDPPTGDSWDDPAGVDECGNLQQPGGDVDFWGLVQEGYLTSTGGVEKGIAYAYDTCSQTPYVYNQTTQIMVSFDNAESFAAKGKFIKGTGLRGFAMWEAGGDYNDILLNSIRSAAGF